MSLAIKAARGAAFNVVASLFTRLAAVVATLFVTRFISPADYGEVLGAAIIAGTCATISNMGLAPYLLANPRAGRQASFHVTLLTTTCFVLIAGVALGLESTLGSAFKLERLPSFLPWLLVGSFLDRFFSLAERIRMRDLHFRSVALNRSQGELLYSACVVVFAWQGLGGWAIVIGNLARTCSRVVVMVVITDWRDWLLPCVPRFATIKQLLRFGLPLSAGGLATYLATRWDNLLTSRYFGAATLGSYNLAYGLADLPIAQVGEQVGDVLLPSFAQLEPQQRREVLARAIRMLAFLMFPLGLGLAAVSNSLVKTFFDARWADVAPMLSILSALAIARPVSYAVTSYLQSFSRTFASSCLDVSRVLLLLVCMVIAAPYGILVVCFAVGLAFCVNTIAGLIIISRDGIPFWRMLVTLARPFAASALMLICVIASRHLLAWLGVRRPAVSLVIEILVGALTFYGSAWLVARQSLADFFDLTRRALGRGKRISAAEPIEP